MEDLICLLATVRTLKTSNVSISKSSTEEFKWQIYSKIWFSGRAFYVTIADADIGSLKSLHILFDKYLDYMLVKFEQNRMVGIIQNFVFFDKKWLKIFDKVLTPLWKTFLRLKLLLDAKILIQRLSSFSVPKIMALRHV